MLVTSARVFMLRLNFLSRFYTVFCLSVLKASCFSNSTGLCSAVPQLLMSFLLCNEHPEQFLVRDYSIVCTFTRTRLVVVIHNVVITKLIFLNTDNSFLDLVMSCLRWRTCCVNVNGQQGCPYCASSGTPQGCVRGALLFCYFWGMFRPL